MARGSIERLAPPGEGLPVESGGDVIARVSKAIGTPASLPDIIGLAIRIPPAPFTATAWDILLVSAGRGLATKFALRPTTSWSTPVSSLMPLHHRGRYWWVRGQMITDIAQAGLSLDDVGNRIARGGVEFAIDQAAGTQGFRPLARLTLSEVLPDDTAHEVAFDPTIHSAPGVELAPRWLTGIRRRAYERSREGRDAG